LPAATNQQHARVLKSLRGAKHLDVQPRESLLELAVTGRELRNEWIRQQILVNRRTDILAALLLGYTVEPDLHLKIIYHQARHHQHMVLAFRGGGKTTIATIGDAIMAILQDPDIRILLASKTLQNSQDFLKEIKGHFEHNEAFREVFGDWVGKGQWDERSIEVNRRTMARKEPTIMTVGVDGAVASKHYDVIYADDLVEEENSRTEHMRERLKRWFYTVLIPCLEPADNARPERGRLSVSGTRYHPDDLYGHLLKNEMAEHTLTIPAIAPDGRSAWESKFPINHLIQLRTNLGSVIFNAQFQCDCEAMKGEVFSFEHFQRHTSGEYPGIESMRVYQGVDLAIGEKEANDLFAQVVIGIKDDHYWVLDYEEARLRFNQQTDHILRFYDKYKPIWCAVEINAYQRAQLHNLKDKRPIFSGMGITTLKDKLTRAWKLTPIFESGRFHCLKEHYLIVDRLVAFPNHKRKDLFDALDLAIAASSRRRTKKREKVGLI
jgi:phage terminase large subunit-like protein